MLERGTESQELNILLESRGMLDCSAGGRVCGAEVFRGSGQLTGGFKGRGGEMAGMGNKEQGTEQSSGHRMRPWGGCQCQQGQPGCVQRQREGSIQEKGRMWDI